MPDKEASGCAPYLSPYRAAVDRMGSCFEALLWNSRETQRLRFAAIADMIDLSHRVVLDAGCGRADLALWLRERGVRWQRYIGIDAIPEMITHARSLALPHADFVLVDFISNPEAFARHDPAPEVVVFSGSLNTIPRSVSLQALERAWRASRHALVFNFLSAGADSQPPDAPAGTAQKLSPAHMLKWALERTRDATLRHDYLDGRDATIVMLKAGERDGE